MKTRLTNRTERLSIIEQLLFRNPNGLRVVEIAQFCDVDRRTIYRDLSLLEEFGVPVYQKDGRFYLNRDYYMATLRLNLNEAVTLLVAARVLTHHQEQQNPYVLSVFRKLSDILPEIPAGHALALAEGAWGNPVDRAYMSALETIIRGWGERRVIKLWDGKTAREFATYFIEPTPSGQIYVVGRDLLAQKTYAFKLRRVKRAKLMKTVYNIPEDFDPYLYLAGDWGIVSEADDTEEVLMTFSAEVLAAVQQRSWGVTHPEKIAEDRYMLRLHVTDWRVMLPWIRSWGAQVEVLAPSALRERLTTEAAALAALYAS